MRNASQFRDLIITNPLPHLREFVRAKRRTTAPGILRLQHAAVGGSCLLAATKRAMIAFRSAWSWSRSPTNFRSNLRRNIEALGSTLEITAHFADKTVVINNIGEP